MKPQRILIVEDNFIVAEDIRRCLTRAGYQVVAIATSGEDVIKNLSCYNPDLVLMDIFLAGSLDGIETARMIQQKRSIPVLYLTAYADREVVERAKLTEPFAFLVKPFRRDDVVSNIEMALYRHEKRKKEAEEGKSHTSITLKNGFSYDLEHERLLYMGREIRLTKKEHRFIYLLVKNRGRTVTFSKIESYVWDDIMGVDENNFKVFLWRLRSKVGKGLIRNIRGIGYRIE